jgi:hypothetical protein
MIDTVEQFLKDLQDILAMCMWFKSIRFFDSL